jgi:tricorn protease
MAGASPLHARRRCSAVSGLARKGSPPMKATPWIAVLALFPPGVCLGDTEHPLLLQKPTVSRTHVAFVYGDDIWIVGRQGGDARKLTTGVGLETDPVFSPDGTQVAFTGEYEGNADVYVVPTSGGVPRRLTYHPGPDTAVGWTPDGTQVLFRSARDSYSRFARLFTVPAAGGMPREVPLPMAFEGSYSPDGTHLAYVPIPPAFRIWKRYRGGRTTPIWIADLADSHIEKVPRDNSNDFNPMWVGDKVYFLSDRNGPVTLFAYDPASKKVSQVLPNDGLDFKSASAGPDVLVYEQFGTLHLYDPKAGSARRLDIRVPGDLTAVRPRFVKVAKQIQNAALSPTGVRAVFEARGEILTVPAEKGDARNLTNSPGVADRDPAWSPDGKRVAYFSDESGEYLLHVRDQRGQGGVTKIALGDPPSFYFAPVWSPDGTRIAYTDKRLNLWYVDLATGKSTRVDTDTYDDRTLDPAWSPDGRWLAYTKQLDNHLRAVFLYSLDTGKTHQVTDGMSDARFARFDQGGKYLYFTASTDIGPVLGWEMSGLDRPVTRSVYVMVLRKDLPSPLAPESDEEKGPESAAADKPAEKKPKAKPEPVRIDLRDIDQRILALPIPAHNYTNLQTGKAGVLFLVEAPPAGLNLGGPGPTPHTLHRFDLAKRKAEKFVEGVSAVRVSHNGEKLLYRQGEGWFIVGTAQPPKPGEGALKLDALEVRIDPRAEWRQMYHEVWRIERDFLYDPGHHGLDLRVAERKYAPYLDNLASRRDLNYLFGEMLGELTLGHVYVFGGDVPEVKHVKGGLLGADYEAVHGRYRFAHIYRGENWNPQLRSPLTEPGVNVRVNEYLLAVDGREVRAPENLYRFFEGTAGRAVVLRVGPNADGKGAREVTVVPIEDEAALRNLSWIDANRRTVDRLSGGRLAYVYVPDTQQEGYTFFNRYFFAQLNREGAVIDERFNSGGIVPDYIVDHLRRPQIGYITTREGRDSTLPVGAIFGPKAMLINEFAGSGGDELPHYFRQTGTGPLIGKRTWGGLVGIDEYPPLIDGGAVTAPSAAFWFTSGRWEVENHGVAPDVEVEFDPQAVRAGHDPQLEKAVEVVLDALKKHPHRTPPRPAFPNYHDGHNGKPSTSP